MSSNGGNPLCEYCDLPLGLFKRKRMCPGCSRWFCTTCLPRDYQFQASNIRLGRNPLGPTPICQRCSILAMDNVTKEHLMELKVKDLRQYLESKRIATAGCREKSELVDLVLQHCCSDAFLRQQAENQRRLRELTRRKEAEEEWEERRGRNQNDISPVSIDSPNRFTAHVASSSTETSSGADDPDDVSIGEEIEVDPAPADDALGAAAAGTTTTGDNSRPVYEVVDDFRQHNGGAGGGDPNSFNAETYRQFGVAYPSSDLASALADAISSANPTAPTAPPSYDEVMATSSTAEADGTSDMTETVENAEEALPQPESNLISDTSTTASPTLNETTTTSSNGTAEARSGTSTLHPAPPPQPASNLSTSGSNGGSDSLSSSPSRFTGRRRIRLEEMEREEDIKEMTPRQLKEILTTNFVAYKGCCERWELEDRVKRLWNEYRVNQEVLRQTYERDDLDGAGGGGQGVASSVGGERTSSSGGVSAASTSKQQPEVDSHLCKICWDAVIDCVLLECGHMVTCTNCGRRMAECPICRQYVVRAVHVFRA